MPKPEDVNPRNFKVNTVLYNDSEFSIVWGEWEDGTMHLAMRWNGETDTGYPKTFGHPVWFLLPSVLTIDIISGILGNKYSNKKSIIDVIQSEYTKEIGKK